MDSRHFREAEVGLLPALGRVPGGSLPMLLAGGGLVAVGVLVMAVANRVATADGVEVEVDTESRRVRLHFERDS